MISPNVALVGLIIFFIYFIAIIGTITLVISILLSFWLPEITSWFITHKIKCIVLAIVIVLFDLFSLYIFYVNRQIDIEIALQTTENTLRRAKKEARVRFTLTEPRQYGELLLPGGTHIRRYDPFDRGEAKRMFHLTGLKYAEFPYPIKIANVWASAIDVSGNRLRLAYDQKISGTMCKGNHMAKFYAPMIENYDSAELKKEPDGSEAQLKPSQWVFQECTDITNHTIQAPPDWAELIVRKNSGEK